MIILMMMLITRKDSILRDGGGLEKIAYFGAKAVWNFSENSPVLEGVGVPYEGNVS